MQLAYKCDEKVLRSEILSEHEVAKLLFVNSTRLALRGRIDISYDIGKMLNVVERDQSQLTLANQQILPIYAVSAEFDSERPDWQRIESSCCQNNSVRTKGDCSRIGAPQLVIHSPYNSTTEH